jgi:hypothetical protein
MAFARTWVSDWKSSAGAKLMRRGRGFVRVGLIAGAGREGGNCTRAISTSPTESGWSRRGQFEPDLMRPTFENCEFLDPKAQVGVAHAQLRKVGMCLTDFKLRKRSDWSRSRRWPVGPRLCSKSCGILLVAPGRMTAANRRSRSARRPNLWAELQLRYAMPRRMGGFPSRRGPTTTGASDIRWRNSTTCAVSLERGPIGPQMIPAAS